jgi:SIR2-like domain
MEVGSELARHEHYLRLGGESRALEEAPAAGSLRSEIEPWLSAVLQSEHLALLMGSGFSLAVAASAGVDAPGMAQATLSGSYADEVQGAARMSGQRLGRSEPNIEDQIRSALALIAGLEVLGDGEAKRWRKQLGALLIDLTSKLLRAEREVHEVAAREDDHGAQLRSLLVSFLLTFASRAASRERLHLFTTNYDRFVEWGCDLAGLRPLDRFVGALESVFRASRLDVDLHYNPPGIRGEPRYLEGVLRLSKLHGSLDWRWEDGALRRSSLPFGADEDHPGLPADPLEALMIYPNPAKDVETLEFPYAEVFRDFSAALCRPNSALVTYGYGFGDDHINRVMVASHSVV